MSSPKSERGKGAGATNYIHRRLSALVKAGRDDLRGLRNRIGKAITGAKPGELVKVSAEDWKNANAHLWKVQA